MRRQSSTWHFPQNRAALEPNRPINANTQTPLAKLENDEAPDAISGASRSLMQPRYLRDKKRSAAEVEFFAGFRVLRGPGFKAAKWILRRRALKLGIRSLRRGAMVALRQCRRC